MSFQHINPVLAAVAAVLLASALYFARNRVSARPQPLVPDAWKEFPLVKKTQISHNTAMYVGFHAGLPRTPLTSRRYRFKLPNADDVFNLPIGQHVAISAEINGKQISRSYTPISSNEDQGYFDLLIKSYEKGNISRHFAQLSIGDKIRVKGPKGQFNYRPGLVGHLSMIAGGSGITPMYQILRAVLANPADKTKVSLIYANVNPEDILLRSELDKLAQTHAGQFTLYYVLNNPPAPWAGGVGFVTKDHIKRFLPNPAEGDSKLLMCGTCQLRVGLPSCQYHKNRSSTHGHCHEVSPLDAFQVAYSFVQEKP
jgi:cytochrome-b5 reductase